MKYYKGKHLVNDNLPPGGIREPDTWEYEEKDLELLKEIFINLEKNFHKDKEILRIHKKIILEQKSIDDIIFRWYIYTCP